MRRIASSVLIFAVGCSSPRPPNDASGIDAAPDITDGDVSDTDAVSDSDAVSDADASPPIGTIPVGLDAYRAWDRWPAIRLGMRTYMRSTFDRAGGNEAGDAAHFIRQDAPDRNVSLDIVGTGTLDFVRTNHWHGSPWHYVLDGNDTVVMDTSTANPDQPAATSVFIPTSLFPAPIALTYAATAGADLMAFPLPFTTSLELAYERTFYGTGYYIYSLFADSTTDLSQPISSWDATTPPDPAVLAFLASAGSDIAPAGNGVRSDQGTVDLAPGAPVVLLDLTGPATIRALKLQVPLATGTALDSARIRITWDNLAAPSVDAPIPLFFGTGTLYNRDGREYIVRSIPDVVHYGTTAIELSHYFPMPFARTAHIELVGGSTLVQGLTWQVRSMPSTDPPGSNGYFHASYVDQGTPVAGRDLVLLDTTAVEGGGDWCGSFVGTSVIFSDQGQLVTLEGDPRFFFDDSGSPQAQGTGTEEWGGGGDYWDFGHLTTLPLMGHPVGVDNPVNSRAPEDLIESEYRYLLADLFPFGRNARIQLEHGGADDSVEHYRTLALWYGLPGACLRLTDSLHVSDAADETAHAYVSPDASSTDTITSRYELGVDHVGATEVFPATTDTGRHTTGTSEFTMAVDPQNVGVMLRRKLDLAYPDQSADVFVGDGTTFTRIGSWYTAGSNQCAWIEAATETGTATPNVETSNRRFRDDEFLIPRSVTSGRSQIRIRIVNTSAPRPITPGATVPPGIWSELRYWAYSYVRPMPP